MNIFPYWVKVTSTIDLRGQPEVIHCYGRSSLSLEDAFRFAQARAARVQSRVNGARFEIDADYSSDIREEIVRSFNAENIVTRNRYGSEVLNSSSICFIDIDQPRLGWKNFFNRPKNAAEAKALILRQIEENAAHPLYRHLGFRLYETPRGVRLIVSGQKFEPRGRDTAALMEKFNCDPLYAMLCRKQNCFRARLTPKSYRMGYKGHRVQFPRTDQLEDRRFQDWLAGYEHSRRQFASCRFLRNIGPVQLDPAVNLHDQQTQAFSSLPLA